jgi:hypothetical protein
MGAHISRWLGKCRESQGIRPDGLFTSLNMGIPCITRLSRLLHLALPVTLRGTADCTLLLAIADYMQLGSNPSATQTPSCVSSTYV